jgi:hypothetical protein
VRLRSIAPLGRPKRRPYTHPATPILYNNAARNADTQSSNQARRTDVEADEA